MSAKDPGMPLSGKATVDALADQWGNIAAFMMRELGKEHVLLTPEGIAAFMADASQPTLVVQELSDGLHIRLVSMADALRMARENKGGFGKS